MPLVSSKVRTGSLTHQLIVLVLGTGVSRYMGVAWWWKVTKRPLGWEGHPVRVLNPLPFPTHYVRTPPGNIQRSTFNEAYRVLTFKRTSDSFRPPGPGKPNTRGLVAFPSLNRTHPGSTQAITPRTSMRLARGCSNDRFADSAASEAC